MMDKTFTKRIRPNVYGLLMVFLVLATRIPFMSRILYNWDAVQFALALSEFNLQQHQPHPPGYVLYIGLGKLLHLVIENPNTVYVSISILASIITVFLFYHFCLLLFSDKKFARISSLILLVVPYFWYYGEVSSSYIFDAVFSMVFAYCSLYSIKKNSSKRLLLFSLLLGLSGGFRQSILVLFLPLWLFVVLLLCKKKNISAKLLLLYGGAVGVAVCVWLVPLIILSHGWDAYWAANQWQYTHASLHTSIFQEATGEFIVGNIKNVIKVILVALNILILTPLVLLFSKKTSFSLQQHWEVVALFVLWFAPSLFVYCFIHFGNPGYIMTIAIGCITIFLIPVYLLYRQRTVVAYGVSAVIAVCFAASFCMLGGQGSIARTLSTVNSQYSTFTWNAITQFDHNITTAVEEIEQFDPDTTLVVSSADFGPSENYFRHLEYYLPQYPVYSLFQENGPAYFVVQQRSPLNLHHAYIIPVHNVEHIIVVGNDIDPIRRKQQTIHKLNVENDLQLHVIDVKKRKEIQYWNYRFIISNEM